MGRERGGVGKVGRDGEATVQSGRIQDHTFVIQVKRAWVRSCVAVIKGLGGGGTVFAIRELLKATQSSRIQDHTFVIQVRARGGGKQGLGLGGRGGVGRGGGRGRRSGGGGEGRGGG